MSASDVTFLLNSPQGPALDLYMATAHVGGLRFRGIEDWRLATVPAELLPPEGTIYARDNEEAVARTPGALVYLHVRGMRVSARVAATTPEHVNATMAQLRERLPAAEEDHRMTVEVGFWNWARDGARRRVHRVEAPSWETIRPNYASSIGGALDELMERREPPEGGRLLLWHGVPGTGKTHLIRALARAWSPWCSTHCIVDVDELLHGATEYLTSLVLDGTGDGLWRLVVLEDAGEFLMADAARTQGQGFSRLLNTLDGMLGQSAKALVLATTNRPLSALDPAITRPGRCALELEVPPLAASEAADWLADRGHPTPIGGEATLAELYAVLRGDPPPEPRRALGFVA
jgi:SpoVK/Ycf46/Vps4 family AAA+-type ATPase